MISPRNAGTGLGLGRFVVAMLLAWVTFGCGARAEDESLRKMQFKARTPGEAGRWRSTARRELLKSLVGGDAPRRCELEAVVLSRRENPVEGFAIEELSLRTLPDRRVHAWLAVPLQPKGKVGGVLALHGHGGSGEEVVYGESLYGYGRSLVEMGYAVISPDIGQHELQHTNWSLMGERVWDSLRCVDYLASRPEVNPSRLAVAGLSLGGETTMYVAALDERLKVACSSGWLTTTTNMLNGHCPCWNFPGLRENFEFSDIFAMIAPRALVCELGTRERAPGGFPVEIGSRAFEEVRNAYRVSGGSEAPELTVHDQGHVFDGRALWPLLRKHLGVDPVWRVAGSDAGEARRRAVLARRTFRQALRVFEGWWATRDPVTGLYPRRVNQPVWAPNDNAADMLPFLALTTYFLAPARLDEVLAVMPVERRLTTRFDGLPDWYALTNRAWLYPALDTNRMVFCAAEYCKDGLIPMTEVMGRGPWFDRMTELVDAIFRNAPVASGFGALPAEDTEVNGEMLQVLCRLYWMTGDERYRSWGERIASAYCFEVLEKTGGIPAARWDFTRHVIKTDDFSLNDHGNEVVGGLSEWAVVARYSKHPKAALFQEALERMALKLLGCARNADGLWIQRIKPSNAQVADASTPDTWGYALTGVATLARLDGKTYGDDALRAAFAGLRKPAYATWIGADSYADSIEGGLLLHNRLPSRDVDEWLPRVTPILLGFQKRGGIVEGWYGDGNTARTELMLGLYWTCGIHPMAWSEDLLLGAVPKGRGVLGVVSSRKAWTGRLIFDRPRHRLHMGLPMNYPRLNEFPEWFTVEAGKTYRVRGLEGRPQLLPGTLLAEGLNVELKAGEERLFEVEMVK